MMRLHTARWALALSFGVTVFFAMGSQALAGGTPLGAAFTYQGEFKVAGVPATGSHHLRFQLWDALIGGAQVGSDVDAPAVAMTEGRFTVPLDFGVSAFDGSARWLQVQVVTNGGATVTPLNPRQPISAAPYALQTRGIFVNDLGYVGIGTTNPTIDFHVHHPGSSTGDITFSSPLGNTAIVGNANNGHRRDIRFTDTGLALCTGGSTSSPPTANGLFIDELGNVGIGTTTPTASLHVVQLESQDAFRATIVAPGNGSGTAVFGEVADSGDATWYAGRFINHQQGSSLNYGVYGEAAGSTGIGAYGRNDSSGGTGVQGDAAGANGIGVEGLGLGSGGIGVVGIGGDYDFLASGPGTNYGSPSSIRWKRNIEAMVDPLAMLAAMRGVMFDWDAEHGGHHDVGMIAEEVGKVLPEIVNYEENGIDASGMDYSKLTPLLVEAVKALRVEKDQQVEAQQEQIDAQARVIEHQQAAIDDLLRRLKALERRVAE
jgi:hypothetical protein